MQDGRRCFILCLSPQDHEPSVETLLMLQRGTAGQPQEHKMVTTEQSCFLTLSTVCSIKLREQKSLVEFSFDIYPFVLNHEKKGSYPPGS